MSLSFIYPAYLWLLLLIPITLGLALIGRPAGNPLRRWGSLLLRVSVLLAIILALAGIQLRLNSNLLTTVFVLDVSDSLTPDQQAYGEQFIKNAIASMKSAKGENQAAIILFGEDALVDRLASQEEFKDLTSIPITTRTSLSPLRHSQSSRP